MAATERVVLERSRSNATTGLGRRCAWQNGGVEPRWIKARGNALIDNALAPFALLLVLAPLVAIVFVLTIVPPILAPVLAAASWLLLRSDEEKNAKSSVRRIA